MEAVTGRGAYIASPAALPMMDDDGGVMANTMISSGPMRMTSPTDSLQSTPPVGSAAGGHAASLAASAQR